MHSQRFQRGHTLRKSSQLGTLLLAIFAVGLPVATRVLLLQNAHAATSQQTAPTQPMAVPRHDHTATALPDGRVLIAGGVNGSGAIAGTEIYDPGAKSFQAAPDMSTARARHTASLLPNGLVLIAGGVNAGNALDSAELFDPVAHAFHGAHPMTTDRSAHAAIVLADGRVLIAGGDTDGTAEIFDPADETFHALPNPLTEPRWGLSATLFSDNSVLLAGGGLGPEDSLETFNPADLTFTRLPYPLATPHSGHPAIPTLDGKLLLFGGNPVGVVEEFDPVTFGVRTVAVLNAPDSTAVGLANGKTLVLLPTDTYVFTPGTNTFQPVADSQSLQRAGATATELPTDSKRILVAGGVNNSNELATLAAVFNPAHITTDKDDYPPYSFVDITGSGFAPNEIVSNQVVQVAGPDIGAAYDPWGVTADANGDFATTWYVFTDDLLNTTLHLTAVGQSSGLKALVEFRDSAKINSVSVGAQSGTVTYGSPGSVTFAVTGSGQNGNGDVAWSITGLPSGTTTNFTPNPSTGNGSWVTTLTITSSASTPAGTFTFTVQGTGDGGGTPATNGTYTVIKRPITVTATANTKTYDGTTSAAATPTLTAGTLASGHTNLLTEAYDTKNQGSGKTLTPAAVIKNAGVDVTANYNITLTSVSAGRIDPATLTYTANTATRAYGAANPAFSGTVSGFVSGENQGNATTGTLTFTTPAIATSPVGSYAINGSGLTANNTNYIFAQAAGNATALTITKAALTITANNRTKIYGQAVTFAGTEFTPIGLQNGETVGSVTLTSAGAGAAATVAGSPYSIIPSAATGGTFASGNYTLSYVNGVLTVAQATTATAVVSSVNPVCFGDSVTFTATVTDSSPSSTGTPTGTVTFKDGASTLGTGALNGSAVATFSTAALSAGSHTVTAVYGADGNFTGSTSPNLAQTVSPTTVGGTATASPNPVCYNTSTTITLSGNTGAIQWQSRTGSNPFADITGETGSTLATGNLTVTTEFRAQVTSGACPSTFSTIATVTIETTPPTISCPANKTVDTDPGMCTAMVSDGALGSATASDNCPGVIVTRSGVPAGNIFPKGTTTITYTATDTAGTTATCMQTVTVTDHEKPVIALTGPSTVTVECHTSYSDAGATALDNCAGSLTPTSVSTVDVNTVGDYTVTFNVTDPSGNNALPVVRTVHVTDTTKPIIALNGPSVLTVECHTGYTDAGATASDTCAGSLTPTSVSTVDANTVGDYTVTFNVTDPSGNNALPVVRTVHVTDTTKPVIMLTGQFELTVECHTGYTDTGATASDTCAGSLTPSSISTVDANTVGDYTVTFNVADPSGNNADTVTRIVHVRDNTKPVITLNGLSELTVECHTSYVDADATAFDSCAGSLTPTSVSTVDENTVGDYTVTFNVTDPSGNNALPVVRTVHVTDTTKPIIMLTGPSELTVECHTSYTDAGATASDTCAGSLAPSSISTVDANTVGDYTVTFNVTDPSGNNALPVVRTVHVTDTTKPIIALNGPSELTVECHTGYTDAGATASDTCAGSLTPSSVSTVDANTVGDYTVTFNVTDPSGNNADTVVRTVHVRDTTKPVITLNGLAELTVECHTSYTDAGATASDTCAGSLAPTPVSTVNINAIGDYTVTFNVADPSGNNADTVTRIVHVRDNTKPVITLNGPSELTVECHTSYVDADATAFDSCAGSLTPTSVSTVDENTVGDYTVTFNVTDPSGNNALPVVRTVHVTDTTKPVIMLTGPSELTVECHTGYTDAGATASDTCAGSLTPSSISTVDANTVGDYTVTFNVADPSGNNADTVTRIVHVRDNTKPVITLNGPLDVTVECHTDYTDAGATASDTCAGSLTPTSVSTVDINTVGNYTVTFNVTDPSGNNALPVVRTVHVTDTTKPIIALNGPSVLTVECHTSYTDAGATASDTCAGTLAPTAVTTVNSDVVGDYTVTFNVADPSGNNADTVTRIVHVRDNTKPVISLLGPTELTIECHTSYTDAGATASDTCAGTLAPTAVTTVDPNSVGDYTVTFNAADPSGNHADTVIRTVHVRDSIKPVITLTGPTEVTVECHTSYTDAGATASDTCAGTLSPTAVGTVDLTSVGDYTVTYNVSDPSGNAADAVVRTIHVRDTTAPMIQCPANIVGNTDPGQATKSGVTYTVNTSDNCGTPTLTQLTGLPSGSTFPLGTTVNTFKATDGSGNSATCSFTVTIEDHENPTIACPANILANTDPAQCAKGNVTYIVTCADNCPGQTLVQTAGLPSGSTFPKGTTINSFLVTDTSGNTTVGSFTVTIQDHELPSLICPAPVSVQCYSQVPVPNPGSIVAQDNCGTPIAVIFMGDVESHPGSSCNNVITRTYQATDTSGNSSTCTQIITVNDTTAPTIACPADITVNNAPGQCSQVVSYTVTATDNCGGAPAVVCAIPSGSTFPLGTTNVVCTATDSCGNTNACSFNVTVNDTQPPTIVNPGNQVVVPLAQPAKFTGTVQLPFNNKPIAAGNFIWFSSTLKIQHEHTVQTSVLIENSTVTFTANSVTYTVNVPNALVIASPNVTMATTTFNVASNRWETTVPLKSDDHTFLVGVPWQVPANLPGNIVATWKGDFTGDRLGVTANWKAAAAVYTSFSSDKNALGVKPINGVKYNTYANLDKAGTPENYKTFVIAGATGTGKVVCGSGQDNSNFTGQHTVERHVIPKKKDALMSICDGVVMFDEPSGFDTCGTVDIECVPPSGSLLGPGVQAVVCSATDQSGNTSSCAFTVTVLAPLRVVFKSPLDDDNIPDNGNSSLDKSDPDWGADAPGTSQVVNQFKSNSSVEHKIKLYDCAGNDVTDTAAVTVTLDVTERQGTYQNSTLINDVPESSAGVGDPAGVMVLKDHMYQFNLKTTGYEAGTVNNNRFFRSCVKVQYRSTPGVVVGIEDVVMESK